MEIDICFMIFYFFLSPKWVKSRRCRQKKKKVVENNGQLCFRASPQVEHASRLDQVYRFLDLKAPLAEFHNYEYFPFNVIFLRRKLKQFNSS